MRKKKTTMIKCVCFFLVLNFLMGLNRAEGGFTMTKIGPKPLWNSTQTDKLRHDLLLNYDKFARPAQHTETTTVQVGIAIRHVEINEMKNTMTVNCWIRLLWSDEKLKWNRSDYGNLTYVHLADHEIWQPDISLYNSASSPTLNNFFNTHIIVDNVGSVMWVPPAQFSVLCEINLKYWPFDTQTCMLKFGSWTYHGEMVDLKLYPTEPAELDLLVKNGEWKVEKVTFQRNVTIYNCCTEPYPDISFHITVKRIPHSYKAIIITPAFAVMFLILMTFCLPPPAGEKVILQGCISIIITMFLMYFTKKLPIMGNHTPLIVLFYSTSLYIVCFSLLGSVAVIWISRTKHTYNLPWIIKQPLMGWLGRGLGLGSYISNSSMNTHRVTAEEMRDHQVEVDDGVVNEDRQMIGGSCSKVPVQQDWILFAAAIDRLSLIFYSFLFVILTLAYSL